MCYFVVIPGNENELVAEGPTQRGPHEAREQYKGKVKMKDYRKV